MTKSNAQSGDLVIEVDGEEVRLRNPAVAAVFAWLLPGAGHLYQGRTRKGWMFMACILTTYFFGFAIGGGHVVYASWVKGDKRWHYLCQVPVGVVSFPAMVQGQIMRNHTNVVHGLPRTDLEYEPILGGLMAPPRRPLIDGQNDELAKWYEEAGAGYEMGTWYTMIAGLLNVLVIYDAFRGPLSIPISGKSDRPPPRKEDDDSEDDEKEDKS